jgi:hypothetical protein
MTKAMMMMIFLVYLTTFPLLYQELRRIFRPKRGEVVKVGEKCIIINFITCTLCQVKDDKMVRACSTHGEKMHTHRILMGKPETDTTRKAWT